MGTWGFFWALALAVVPPETFDATGHAAPFSARTGHAAEALAGAVYVVGGVEHQNGQAVYLNDVWRYARPQEGQPYAWTRLLTNDAQTSARFSPRARHSLTAFDGKLYLVGGLSASGAVLADVWRSSDGSTWERVAATGFSGRAAHGAAVVNGKLLVAGGWNGHALNDVWEIAPATTRLVESAPWEARSDFAFVSFGGYAWVLGGRDGDAFTSSAWYSADGVEWYPDGQDTPRRIASKIRAWFPAPNTAATPEDTATLAGTFRPDDLTQVTRPDGTPVLLLFAAADAESAATKGRELYAVDDAEAFALVKDILPGRESSEPRSFLTLGGAQPRTLFLVTNGPDAGLWRTDGTAAGTQKLALSVPVLYDADDPAPVAWPLFGTDYVVFQSGGQLYVNDGYSDPDPADKDPEGNPLPPHTAKVTAFETLGLTFDDFVVAHTEAYGYVLYVTVEETPQKKRAYAARAEEDAKAPLGLKFIVEPLDETLPLFDQRCRTLVASTPALGSDTACFAFTETGTGRARLWYVKNPREGVLLKTFDVPRPKVPGTTRVEPPLQTVAAAGRLWFTGGPVDDLWKAEATAPSVAKVPVPETVTDLVFLAPALDASRARPTDLLLAATTAAEGTELYRATPSGLSLVKAGRLDAPSGLNPGIAPVPGAVPGGVYYAGADRYAEGGEAVWYTDGTTGNTFRIAGTGTDYLHENPYLRAIPVRVWRDRLFFFRWMYDFGPSGTDTPAAPTGVLSVVGVHTAPKELAFARSAVAATPSGLLVVGGLTPDPVYNARAVVARTGYVRLSPGSAWTPMTVEGDEPWKGRVDARAVALDGNVYLLGGEGTRRQTRVSILSKDERGPTADFICLNPTESEGVRRFADRSVAGTYPIESWRYDFGDGTVEEITTPRVVSHRYRAPGYYTVTLTVKTQGGQDSETKTHYIYQHDPVARPE